MRLYTASKTTLCVVLLVALMGCKTAAERAEVRFQSALALIEEGDTARATVEFRNVFELDDTHLEARLAFAKMLQTEGNLRGAYRNYLRAAEQYPEELEVRQSLAELAFEGGNWDEFVRHGTTAVKLAKEVPRSQAIALGLNYRTAVLEGDSPAREALVGPTEALLLELPDNVILNSLLLYNYTQDSAFTKALARLDTLISVSPEQKQLYNRRLALLAQMQDRDAIEAQLQDMVERFPEDADIQAMLLRFYVSQQRLDEAEAFLRDISDPAAEDPTLFMNLVQFLLQVEGEEAARVEIARGIAESPQPNTFKSLLATLDFRAGEQDKAVAELESILEDEATDPQSEETQRIKIILARMLGAVNNQVGAQRLVEEVLATNSTQTDALKMQAAWQIQADEPDSAIANLRLALDSAPNDVQALNLMYEAHIRAGEPDLARDFLSQTVEASGNAPDTSVRYARVLISEERYLPAEDVLLPALRLNPSNLEILRSLGSLYFQMEDFPRAEQVIKTLERLDTEQSQSVATQLRAAILSRQSGTEDALKFLEDLADGENGNLQSNVTLLRALLSTGKTAEAIELAQRLITENPDVLGLKQALAQAQLTDGDLEGAQTSLREVIEAAPANSHRAWLQLSRIASGQGLPDEAEAIIDEALVATNNNANVLWAKASFLERSGNYEEAIEIYETLYAQNSSSIVVANNLASLITTYRDDPESLERAWAIARRLRETNAPALQDTYGWIAFRRGEIETSLPYLENAAAGLPNDPIVQIHLGLNYVALDRNEEALTQLQKAVEIAGPADTRARVEQARAEIARLRTLIDN